MITDRIRKKQLNAYSVLGLIQSMEAKEEYDTKTLEYIAKRITKQAFIGDALPGDSIISNWEANEPFEIAELLRDLNHLISTLYKLADTGYYLDYIFNNSVSVNKEVERLGFIEDYCMELGDKFEKLRYLLYGDCFNWREIEILLMRNAAYTLREDNERLEDRNKTLEYKVKEGK